jgi:nitrite reductase/ring-hydroxylating ferredoxin subunit
MSVNSQPSIHPRPTGWYAVGFSSDLRLGRVHSRGLFGQRFATFRTAAGVPVVLHSVCPHLGADLSRGRVCGERLVCPFHRFEYDREGHCVATPYPGRVPSWEPEPPSMQGWTVPRGRCFELAAHPLSTSENSVDIGHFSTLHGFDRVEITTPIRADGPYLTGSYEFGHRVAGVLLRNTFTVHLWGLGYSLVENRTHGLELNTRLWIFSTPTHPGRVELRVATAATVGASKLAGIAGAVVRELALLILSRDVQQDFDVWTHRTHIDQPALAPGDGPVGAYRRWARQFDPSDVNFCSPA